MPGATQAAFPSSLGPALPSWSSSLGHIPKVGCTSLPQVHWAGNAELAFDRGQVALPRGVLSFAMRGSPHPEPQRPRRAGHLLTPEGLCLWVAGLRSCSRGHSQRQPQMWPMAQALGHSHLLPPLPASRKGSFDPLTRPQTSAITGRSLMARRLVGSERAGNGDLWVAEGPGPPEPLGGSGLAAALFS